VSDAYDPLNPEQSKEDARRSALVAQTEHADDVRRLMAEPWGRRLMWSWLEFGGVFQLSFQAGQADVTAYKEGNRNFGLMLFASIMEHAPEKWALMQREASEAKAQRDAAKKGSAEQPQPRGIQRFFKPRAPV